MARKALAKEVASRYVLVVETGTILEPKTELPTEIILLQNYPNPFNPSTLISYAVPKRSEVRLEVFDILGRSVSTLINNETKAAGTYKVQFDAKSLTSGMYFYRLKVGNTTITKNMMLIK